MQPANLIVFMSDSHSAGALGCHGHPVARTPHLDALAARGTRFAACSSASPLCCPARAAFATGRFPHQTGYWDNVLAYDGRIPSWMHRLRDAGREVVSIGKLHFRSEEDDTGFSRQIAPMHILNGTGGVIGLLRWNDQEPERTLHFEMYTKESGVGPSSYMDYDKSITRHTLDWLRAEGAKAGQPWTLFVSYACPHPPFQVEQRHWDLYGDDLPLPPDWRPENRPDHAAVDALRSKLGFGDVTDPVVMRRMVRAYLAIVSHLDEQIGQVLAELDALGLAAGTRVAYTSDHGESLGRHGLLGKCTLYESALAVPLIMAGPGVRAGAVVEAPVSLVDLFPTILESQGVPLADADADLPGRSLWPLLRGEAVPPRPVFAEYHGTASRMGAFMLREGNLKLIHHAGGWPAQLFDLEADPLELHDQAASRPQEVARLRATLGRIVDPEAVDRRAKADQRAMAEKVGGDAAIRASGAFPFTPPPGTEARRVEVR